jgi:hypothetical protein
MTQAEQPTVIDEPLNPWISQTPSNSATATVKHVETQLHPIKPMATVEGQQAVQTNGTCPVRTAELAQTCPATHAPSPFNQRVHIGFSLNPTQLGKTLVYNAATGTWDFVAKTSKDLLILGVDTVGNLVEGALDIALSSIGY